MSSYWLLFEKYGWVFFYFVLAQIVTEAYGAIKIIISYYYCCEVFMLFQSLYRRFKKVWYTVFPLSVCPSFQPSSSSLRPMNIFVEFFHELHYKDFWKVYWNRLYRVISFQIHHSTTSCLPNTFHITAKLKKNRHIFLKNYNLIQRFLKIGFGVYISQLYCVMLFQIQNSTTKYLGEVSSVVCTIIGCLYALYRPFNLEKWNILFCFILYTDFELNI